RFLAQVEATGNAMGCHRWRGRRDQWGYGLFGDGTAGWCGGERVAHRCAWYAEHGPVPEGFVLRHTCGIRDCVNVEHLRLVRRGSWNKGARGRPAKLSAAQINEVRQRYAAGGTTYRALGAAYGVSHVTVANIVKG